jgi:hypothetical protein
VRGPKGSTWRDYPDATHAHVTGTGALVIDNNGYQIAGWNVDEWKSYVVGDRTGNWHEREVKADEPKCRFGAIKGGWRCTFAAGHNGLHSYERDAPVGSIEMPA